MGLTADKLMQVPARMCIRLKQPKQVLWNGLQHFIGPTAKPLPEYAQVAKWLGDNRSRGLMLMGDMGRGKSIIAMHILPLILNHFYQRTLTCVSAYDMNSQIDALKQKQLLVLDDVGVERPHFDYGNRRDAFCEIVDAAEQHGALLIVTTNLNSKELLARYGERTYDRLRGMMTLVTFMGKSMR